MPVLHLYRSILRGHIDSTGLAQPERGLDSDYYYYAKAVEFQYQNNIPKALANYNKGLAAARELSYAGADGFISKLKPQSPFYCLTYIRALCEDVKPSAEKKLYALLSKDRYTYGEELPLSSKLYLCLILEEKSALRKCLEALPSAQGMDFVLSVIVVGHYKLAPLSSAMIARATAMIEQNQWDLLPSVRNWGKN